MKGVATYPLIATGLCVLVGYKTTAKGAHRDDVLIAVVLVLTTGLATFVRDVTIVTHVYRKIPDVCFPKESSGFNRTP